MTNAYRVTYQRRIGLTSEMEVCACYIDKLWNIRAEPIKEGVKLEGVSADDAAMICRYIIKNMRPGERVDVQYDGDSELHD